MSLGETLQKAREAQGLSIRALAEETRLDESILAGLEKEDFQGLVNKFYGINYIKTYAKRLGVDFDPLLKEFNELYANKAPTSAEPVVGNYKAQEALSRERANATALYTPENMQAHLDDPSTQARPMVQQETPPPKVSVKVIEEPAPQPVAEVPLAPIAPSPVLEHELEPVVPAAAATPAPIVAPIIEPIVETAPEPIPEPAPEPIPEPLPLDNSEAETTIVIEAAAPTAMSSLFETVPPAPEPEPTPAPPAPAPAPAPVPAPIPAPAPAAPAPVPPPPLEEDEGTLFGQAAKKPRPISVDPEDEKNRPMTGIFVPPSRRKAETEAAAAPAPSAAAAEPTVPSAAEPAPASGSPLFANSKEARKPTRQIRVQKTDAPRTGPSVSERAIKMLVLCGAALGRGLRATGRLLGRALKATGRGLGVLLRALGKGLLAFGRFTLAHGRSLALVSVALVMLLLGIWAVVAISHSIRNARATPRVVSVQQKPATPVDTGSILSESSLPPPSLYAK